MKKINYVFALTLCIGCMNTQKATNYLDAHNALSALCAQRFPVQDSSGQDKIIYRPTENLDYQHQIDSIGNAAQQLTQRLFDQKNSNYQDSEAHKAKVDSMEITLSALNASIAHLKRSYRPCLPDTLKVEHTVYRKDAAAISACNVKYDDIKNKYYLIVEDREKIAMNRMIWRIVALLLVGSWIVFAFFKITK